MCLAILFWKLLGKDYFAISGANASLKKNFDRCWQTLKPKIRHEKLLSGQVFLKFLPQIALPVPLRNQKGLDSLRVSLLKADLQPLAQLAVFGTQKFSNTLLQQVVTVN